ncbi:MAG: orotate phosphoribosyltransferase [Bacteroidetes bacterium CG12_big_fil_rev_8_21_14_0_65_60_17]|nr:MAG: orotate phosphoribosyltransferase [Bacteroidetes bacterium CG12_big_fil_rev_8_21_14_0_65_60_17]
MAVSSTPAHAELVNLGQRLYDLALVKRDHEHITDPQGQPIGWLLDTRIPMLRGDVMREVGRVLATRLEARSIHQVAGFGFGAFALVGSVVATPAAEPFMGGLIRDKRKPHGRQRLVEGPLDRSRPVVFLDDILNSGKSALRGIHLLRQDGFQVAGMMCLFQFTWSAGKTRLEQEGLWVDAILDLKLRHE